MRPNIIPTFILCAILLMEAKAQEQSSSGYGAEGSTSTDDGSGADGSGSNTQDVEKMVNAMRKLNKNKSDDELSKNIKTGSFLKNIPIRTFEKLSALWISIIRRLWKVWRAKGARKVMHSIVEKIVTHTGKKVTKAFNDEAEKKSETPGNEETTHSDSQTENLHDAPEITEPQSDVKKISSDKANEATKPDSFNTDVNTDSSLREPAPNFGQPQVAAEKNPLKETSENSKSPSSSLDSTKQSEESNKPENDSQKQENSQLNNQNTPNDSSPSTNQNSTSNTDVWKVGTSMDNAQLAENKDQNPAKNGDEAYAQATTVKERNTSQATSDEATSLEDSQKSVSDDASLQSVSINVENPIKDEVNSFVRNKNAAKTPTLQTSDRYLIPQEQTPESITANTGSPSDSNFRKNRKKNNQGKSKIKYKMHSHSQNTHKHKNKNTKNLQATYTNVNKHLIKRSKAKKPFRHLLAKEMSFEGPISNELESVLNANAVTAPIYTKSNYYGRNNEYNDEPDSGNSEVSSGESVPNSRNYEPQLHNRKRKISHRSRKYKNKKLGSRHRLRSQRTRTSSPAFAVVNKTLQSKTVKNEGAAKKFKFISFPRDVPNSNQTSENQGPIITPSPATESRNTDEELENSEPDQSSPDPVQPEQQVSMPVQLEFPNSIQNQPVQPVPIQAEQPHQVPVLVVKPTSPQSEDDNPVMIMPTTAPRPIVPNFPTNEPSPPSEDDSKPSADAANDVNVTVIAQEDNNPEQQHQQQPSSQDNAVFEEVRSLESRMTVLEAAVAEVIEWIKSHSNKPAETGSSSQVSLRPALPYHHLPPLSETQEETPGLHEVHNPKVLKQIFIPLPPPDTEAEKEVESGQPVSGLPFPLNFIVSKMLGKMLKAREQQRIASHPHTPGPDINIPAIEHDINRLEKELGTVPRPFHHRHHRLRLHKPMSDDNDVKHPLLGQLVSSEPEKEAPECASTCQNGGMCVGDNICRCPSPYTGPHCEIFQPMINPTTRRVIMDRQDERVPESLRRSSFNRYNPSARQKISDHRERRRLVQALKSILRNLVPESLSARKNRIPMDDISPDFQNQDDGELDDSYMNQGMFQSSPDSI